MRKGLLIISVLLLATGLAGCGGNNNKALTNPSQLVAGKIYVEHTDENGEHTYEPLYFPSKGTADNSQVDKPDDERMFFLTDEMMDKIPTFSAVSDKLVAKHSKDFIETQTFERYEYMGYSLGMQGLQSLESGRLKVSLKDEDNNYCPGSDVENTLSKMKNTDSEYVTLDSIGGTLLRTIDADGKSTDILTRAGTIKGLMAHQPYQCDIYTGTEYTSCRFLADYQILCSMDVTTSLDYMFDSVESLMDINVPSFFHTGFYLVDGVGLMRYVPEGVTIAADTDYNIENDAEAQSNVFTYTIANNASYEEFKKSGKFVSTGGYPASDYRSTNPEEYVERTVNIDKKGYATVVATVSDVTNTVSVTEKVPEMKIVLVTSWGSAYTLEKDADNPNIYKGTFYCYMPGDVALRCYGPAGRAVSFKSSVETVGE